MSFFLPFVHTFFFLVIPGATALMIRRSSTKRRRYHGAIYDLNLQGGVCFMDDMSFFSLFLTWFPCCAGIYLFHFFWYISIRNFVYIWQSQSCIMTCPLYPSCLPPFFPFPQPALDLIYLEYAPSGISLPFTKLYQESSNRKKAKKLLPLSSRLIIIITTCRVDSRYAWFVNTQFSCT